jgi:hypothetical protein
MPVMCVSPKATAEAQLSHERQVNGLTCDDDAHQRGAVFQQHRNSHRIRHLKQVRRLDGQRRAYDFQILAECDALLPGGLVQHIGGISKRRALC